MGWEFGNHGKGDEEFNQPRCLSVDKIGHLMVCDLWNRRIQVFELSANYKVWNKIKVSGIGEVSGFSSKALSDGRIVIADYWSHPIQIFA